MPLNTGFIEMTNTDDQGRQVVIRIYYDSTFSPVGPDQPLINGPRGYCLDMTNVSGRNATVVVYGLTNNPITITVGQGNPVTTGPASGRSRTAAELASFGFTTRGNLGQLSL